MPYTGSEKPWSIADPGEMESQPRGFDFTDFLNTGETLSNAGSWWINDLSGLDDEAGTRLIGSPSINGNVVAQFVGNLIAGAMYEIGVTITTSAGRKATYYSNLRVSGTPA